jgi:hypothetical protein
MIRTCVTVIVGLALAVPAGALPNCSVVANFQACNAYCGMFGGSCFQVGYNQDPFGEGCEFRYSCTSGGSTGWGPCNCGGPGGCMVPGTQIALEDGSSKAVEEIRVGDRVMSYDETTGTMTADQVAVVHDPVDWTYYIVINGELRLTPSHSVLSNGTWIEAAEIRPGDAITRADGTAATVESLDVVEKPVTVHNIATSPNHTFVANGYIVHNKAPIPREEPPNNDGD